MSWKVDRSTTIREKFPGWVVMWMGVFFCFENVCISVTSIFQIHYIKASRYGVC